jgi:hypothetical protein
MTKTGNTNGSVRTSGAQDALAQAERQLGLVDRLLGLEAQVAELSVRLGHAPVSSGIEQDLVRTRTELDAVYRSATWKVGLVVSFPIRAVRKILKLVTR